jgi:cobalamin biosynthesis Mg chelatase CobN
VTGGTGFNVAMQIVPSSGGGTSSSETCRVLSCLEDGCEDAYQFPDQDARTHSCGAGIEFQVVFCPDNSTVSTTSDSAVDYWVDASSATASESNSTSDSGSSDASGSMDGAAQVESQSETTDAPSSSKEKTTANTASGDSSGTSTAVYAVAGVAAGVVAVVAAAFAFKRRHAIAFWWETRNYKEQDACSSDELGFVRVSDDAII